MKWWGIKKKDAEKTRCTVAIVLKIQEAPVELFPKQRGTKRGGGTKPRC